MSAQNQESVNTLGNILQSLEIVAKWSYKTDRHPSNPNDWNAYGEIDGVIYTGTGRTKAEAENAAATGTLSFYT